MSTARYRPAPSFPELGDGFFDAVRPARFPLHRPRFKNLRWAERIGLGELTDAQWEEHFARFEPLPGNLPEPLALRYHGHQFGVYNPDLGDGRGFLFAQLRDGDGRLLDLGTKGSGKTPWSRGGDGRLTLKGGFREVLATEMLEALGVNTSKSFSLFETGEMLMRGDEPSPTRSSVLVRLSHSHVRIGSFQRHAHKGDVARIERLLEYAALHYLPCVRERTSARADLAIAFFEEVTSRLADLCASWMVAGFVHGVLNSDNLAVTGESFDYGPYRFLPRYDPGFVAAYFDETGLYAFGRQGRAVAFGLARLADALRLVSPAAAFEAALGGFERRLASAHEARFLSRLGVAPSEPDADANLVEACLAFMRESGVGYDRFFFDWYGGIASESRARERPAAALYTGSAWTALWRLLAARTPVRPALLDEPYFHGRDPETLLIDEIEALWTAIATADDWAPFEAKISRIRAMGAVQRRMAAGTLPRGLGESPGRG